MHLIIPFVLFGIHLPPPGFRSRNQQSCIDANQPTSSGSELSTERSQGTKTCTSLPIPNPKAERLDLFFPQKGTTKKVHILGKEGGQSRGKTWLRLPNS